MAISIIVPWEYPFVLASIVLICLECVVIGFAVVVPARMKHFNAKFMEQFKVEH